MPRDRMNTMKVLRDLVKIRLGEGMKSCPPDGCHSCLLNSEEADVCVLNVIYNCYEQAGGTPKSIGWRKK
jgi:hypothetical protein